MRVGTKSVLFGAHCFFLHPWFVAAAWTKLYGFPFDPRMWFVFMLHDIGYFGKPNMDGEEGERHPWTGAKIVSWLFDDECGVAFPSISGRTIGALLCVMFGKPPSSGNWYSFSLYHSRFLAKKYGVPPSLFCVADKLAITLVPWWLYLPMVNWTGEIKEYMAMSVQNGNTKYAFMSIDHKSQREWYLNMQAYLRKWVAEHRDGKEDTWTPEKREARDDSGVWQ